jgi:hypothetical protein
MLTVTLTFSSIIDMIMAADGLSASLDRSDGLLTVINDDHEAALTLLAKQAIAIVAAEAGETITTYTITDNGIAVQLTDSVTTTEPATSQLLTAVVWRTLQLAYAGCNPTRAATCATTAAAATTDLAARTPPCPPFRTSY